MSMEPFVWQGLPSRVVFGHGTLSRVADEADRLGITRALLITTPPQAAIGKAIADLLGQRAAAIFHGATMHSPIAVTEQAMRIVVDERINGTIAIGGGSTIGLGKAIAWRTDLPQIAIPTTYAGSEMTPILGETADGLKTTKRDAKILPETVIYDVDLTLTLPAAMSGTSGMNAIAHAVEALYAQDRNPVISLMAEEGISAMAGALPTIARNPADPEARAAALYGAWLCGSVLGAVGMALHHKLCHALGGSFDLPHAETHTIILPHAVAYTAPAVPEAMRRVARALGTSDAALGLHELATVIGAPTALAQIGMKEADLDRAAEIATANPYWNPRAIDRAGIRALLDDAFHGRKPRVW
jgi:maleylacetate reductase